MVSASSAVCVDACLVMRLVVGGAGEQAVHALWREWTEEQTRVLAPSLLAFECVNALRQLERARVLTSAASEKALDDILALGMELVYDPVLLHRALVLSRELALPSAYDAQYLALSEWMDVSLFTADGRLVQKVGKRFPRLCMVGGE
ncbi:MAG: type II toxin-antitoxin system VapC family toxin [Deltaproteobacteria bacterium]|nr:type II toxin-antitoxin system VapC family toxin [Deltaproteobacteria bacterium]